MTPEDKQKGWFKSRYERQKIRKQGQKEWETYTIRPEMLPRVNALQHYYDGVKLLAFFHNIKLDSDDPTAAPKAGKVDEILHLKGRSEWPKDLIQ